MRSMRRSRPLFSVALLLAATALPAQTTTPAAPGAAAAPSAAPAATGLRAELVAQLDDAERKLVALAEATPQAKYGYRPAAGVRSTSEVFMHVVGANYMIPGMVGAARPADVQLTPSMEKTVTGKAQIVELLRKSFAHAKAAAGAVPEGEMDASVNLFGRQSTKRGVLVLMATHAHEHLGQSIAYARASGVTPPWSRGREGN
jgi:uncharacterized damage-inducible protein DinB